MSSIFARLWNDAAAGKEIIWDMWEDDVRAFLAHALRAAAANRRLGQEDRHQDEDDQNGRQRITHQLAESLPCRLVGLEVEIVFHGAGLSIQIVRGATYSAKTGPP
jgi:hypothetical protein